MGLEHEYRQCYLNHTPSPTCVRVPGSGYINQAVEQRYCSLLMPAFTP